MKLITSYLGLFTATISVLGHEHHDGLQMPLDYVRFPYQAMYPGDNDGTARPVSLMMIKLIPPIKVTADSVFSGITTFAKLPWVQCLGKDKEVPFDVAFIGAPFVCFPSEVNHLVSDVRRRILAHLTDRVLVSVRQESGLDPAV